MADSADLVVLGAWYGTGQKGGMMSVFLMGCFDEHRKCWCTVTKVHTGHDDSTLERLQTELGEKVIKISKDINKVPSWLRCTKTMVPDFVAKDPKLQPVWEITGAEFTKNVVHTADGISVRFPRVTRIRSDKEWSQATSLAELQVLYTKSKETADFSLSVGNSDDSPYCSPPKSSKKRAASTSPVKASKKQTTLDNSSATTTTSKKRTLQTTIVTTAPKVAKKTEDPKTEKIKLTKQILDAFTEHKRQMRGYVLKYPLPDVFVGVRLFFPDKIPKKEKDVLERYFVALMVNFKLFKKFEKMFQDIEVNGITMS